MRSRVVIVSLLVGIVGLFGGLWAQGAKGPKAQMLLYGRTSGGVNTPVQTDASGVVKISGGGVPLRGVTGSIGGSLLAAGACTGGTATVTGATTGMMVAAASPVADPDPGLSTGVVWDAFVSGSNTVTVRVCGLAAVTPTATTYQVSVIP